MPSKLCMWGNSHGVRLPKYIIERTGLKVGDYLYVRLEAGEIVIRPVRACDEPAGYAAANDAKLPDEEIASKW